VNNKYEEVGKNLKNIADPNGIFVDINKYNESNFSNVYDLLQTLLYFFKWKKHEWIAFCFLDESFNCKSIWFNKGDDNEHVSPKISVDELIEKAKNVNAKYIVRAHNHPASGNMTPNYRSKYDNIRANKQLQDNLTNFSDQDLNSYEYFEQKFNNKGILFADSVLVSGNQYKYFGANEIVKNHDLHKSISEAESRRKYFYSSMNEKPITFTWVLVIFIIIYILISILR